MNNLLAKLFRLLRGKIQWYILWLFHHKFIIGVSGVVLNGQGQVLLLRHRYWRKGSWGLPSGYAERGERLEDTLAREVKEETGYEIQVDKLLILKSGFLLRIEVTFNALLAGGDLKLDTGEILEARFFNLSELPIGLLDSHRAIVQSLLEDSAGEPNNGEIFRT